MPAIEPSLRLPLLLSNGLKWLAPEVDASLHRIRLLIEQQQDVEEAALETRAILDELKLVRGALQMAGCCGGAILANELHAAVEAVAGGKLEQPASALAAVSGATLQLSDYLDALQHDAPDRAAVLQPAISELRLASGRIAATEADVFVQQMQMRAVQLSLPTEPERLPGAAASMAAKLLPVFQAMLLQWLRGQDVFNALLRLRKVGDHLANSAVVPDVLLLWTVFSATADALMTASTVDSLELKRCFGRIGQQIKLLAEKGESAAEMGAAEMAWRLLAHAAVINNYEGTRWQALRKALPLDAALPIESELASARRKLRGPNTRLLEKVAQEVRAELALVKDTLDLAQRAGTLSADGLTSTRDRLTGIANTLSLLGLGQLEQILRNQCGELLLLGAKDSQQGGWLRMATALLRVEYSLEMSMFRPLQAHSDVSAASDSEMIYAVPHAQDLRDSAAVLVREILVDLAKLKAQLDSFIKGEPLRDIDEPAELLNEVSAGLIILDQQQAAALVTHLYDWLGRCSPNAFRNDTPTAVRFADAIAALELYLEALRDALPRPDLMLATLKDTVVFFEAESALLALAEIERPVAALPEEPVPAEAPPPEIASAEPQVPAAVAESEPEVDPEIRAIFIEEVDEVSEALKRLLPGFARDPSDIARLADIRRAFHTLKGSGRMVGATRIGELGWAVESLLNRCIEGALPVNKSVVTLIEQAHQQLAGLRADFHSGSLVSANDNGDPLIARAQYLASGRAPEMVEADVLGVFRTDAMDRLADVERWLSDDAAQMIDPDAARALHTLKGAAAVVNAEALSHVSGALEAVLKQLIAADAPAPPEVRAVLAEVVPVLRRWILQAGEVDGAEPGEWLSRIEALTHFLPPPGDTRSLVRRESLVNLAFDNLQAVERQLQLWASEPSTRSALVDSLQQLATTAQDCAPLVLAATAMAERLRADDLVAATLSPSPAFIQALASALEHFYRFLDAYREGSTRDNGRALAATIRRLPLQGEALTAGDVQAMLSPPAGADQELIRLFAEEAHELLVVVKNETRNWQPPAMPSALLLQTLHTLMGSARIAGYVGLGDLAGSVVKQLGGVPGQTPDGLVSKGPAIDVRAALATLAQAFQIFASRALLARPEGNAAAAIHAADPELAGIFIAEAAEMLEAITAALEAWRRDPHDRGAIRELNRALHTLKGGARMTGYLQMGDASHEMESQVVALLMDKRVPTTEEFAELGTQLEALEHMHDALSRGDVLATAASFDAAPPVFIPDDDIKQEWQQPPVQVVSAPPPSTPAGWQPDLFWRPEDETATSTTRRELARVPVEALDAMLNEAGEISIYRSRLEQQNTALVAQLTEMRQTIGRLRDQLRLMDIETDAQIAARGLTAQTPADAADHYEQDFDPLEMDRYSRMQELSRTLAEAVGDLGSLHLSMDQGVNEAQALLMQQGRINAGVQQGLMGTLMVPFSRQVARLQRVVRQTAQEEGLLADISFEGVESELDRNVLERMTVPLEHLLRNAVVHGLENPASRRAAGKPEQGAVKINLKREGTQLVMEIADDGRGLDFQGIRSKAVERGLLPAGAELGDDEIARFIFETGFSTAEKLTQSAGRGVGLDVVASEVKQLGGTLELRSEAGRGTRFTVRLPLSLALSQALMVMVGDETYALPLTAIEGIGRVPRAVAQTVAEGGEAVFAYAGHDYRVRSLAELIDRPYAVPDDVRSAPAVLVRLGEGVAGGERRAALVVDQLLGNREVVSKAVGAQLSSISGLSGATILPDGQVVLMLDPAALVIDRARRRLIAEAAAEAGVLEQKPVQLGRLIMVVDDSVTMRRVAERLLQRSGYRVITAKDGLDAIALLQDESPAAILLDIEMPRADGFEVAGFVRNSERIRATPIIMITSRSGDKHRARAATLGVDRYLIKPYQEDQLLHELGTLLQQREATA